jgi:triosephosphate isomerase (TIM)
MYKNPKQAREFFAQFLPLVSDVKDQIVFFPPSICLDAVSTVLGPATAIQFGTQNCWFEIEGAFTGETSASVVKELGGQWVLVGHSERRKIFAESSELTAKKINFIHSLGLTPMLCLGETWPERQAGKTLEIVSEQLKTGIANMNKQLPLAIAYEPVWAIGTGQVATTAQVLETHSQIKDLIRNLGLPSDTPVLYGGSVKPENAAELKSLPVVDGFLVGGASLAADSFAKIIKA